MQLFRFPTFKYFKELYLALLIIVVIAVVGSIGYMVIEDFEFSEAFYMTIITVSTVGFNEIQPLSAEGRYFTIFLIVISFGTFAYALSSLSKYIMTGTYAQYLKKYKMDKNIEALKDHVVICGAGSNGSEAIRNLMTHGKEIVVVETNPDIVNELKEKQIMYVEGDATDEDTLLRTGIKQASALISTLPKDTDNVFVVLTAREFNPHMRIVSRCAVESTESKLRNAGANYIILPDKVGGARMAGYVVNQNLNRFLDKIALTDKDEAHLIEVHASKLPVDIQNRTVTDVNKYLNTTCKLIGIRTAGGEYMVNPSEDTPVPHACEMFYIGNAVEINGVQKILDGEI